MTKREKLIENVMALKTACKRVDLSGLTDEEFTELVARRVRSYLMELNPDVDVEYDISVDPDGVKEVKFKSIPPPANKEIV